MKPAALHKILNEIFDSSQVFERWIFEKQPKRINKIKKNWDKITVKCLKQSYPKQHYDFSLDGCCQRQFCLVYFIFLIIQLYYTLIFSILNLDKKDCIIFKDLIS